MKRQEFQIVYDGPGLMDNTMDVRSLAPALLAIGETLEAANSVLNGEQAQISVKVHASFKTGSFGIDLGIDQSIVDTMARLFNDFRLVGALNLLATVGYVGGGAAVVGKGVIQLIKWLRGRNVDHVEIIDENTVRVHVGDEHEDYEREVIEVFRDIRFRKALEKAVYEPLQSAEIDVFATTEDGRTFFSVEKREASYFVAPTAEDEKIEEVEQEMNLQLVSVSFQEGHKWRFTDGASTFYADVMDEGFIESVQHNETAFSKGDILRALVSKTQKLVGDDLRTEYKILRIVEHRPGYRQLPLKISPKTRE